MALDRAFKWKKSFIQFTFILSSTNIRTKKFAYSYVSKKGLGKNKKQLLDITSLEE